MDRLWYPAAIIKLWTLRVRIVLIRMGISAHTKQPHLPEGSLDRGSWYGKKTYYSHYVEEQEVEDIYAHTIKADYEISVNFIGGETGNISVISMPAVSFCMDRSPTDRSNAH